MTIASALVLEDEPAAGAPGNGGTRPASQLPR